MIEASEQALALKSPFPWFGGKRRVAHLVWERFGKVPNFVEPFFGSGAVLLARPHAPKIETINDADAYVSNFWRSVQADPEAVAHWADWPVSEPDLHARHRWLVTTGAERVEVLKSDPAYYDAQVAGWWVWGICQWIGSGWCTVQGATWDVRPNLGGAAQGNGIHAALPAKLPSLGDAGRGGHRAPSEKRPHLGNAGCGVHRGPSHKLPHLSDAGQGGERPAPSEQLPCMNTGRGVHRLALPASVNRTAWLLDYMTALSERLRHVRVCCGDWARVMGPSPTFKNGLTAVFLDPPYSHDERQPDLYSHEGDVADAVRDWCLANGDNPLLRIALCGYEGEHEMPASWEMVRWKAAGGYGSQGEGSGRDNAAREAIWFSPACLKGNEPRQSVLPFAL